MKTVIGMGVWAAEAEVSIVLTDSLMVLEAGISVSEIEAESEEHRKFQILEAPYKGEFFVLTNKDADTGILKLD
jgi:hypothetical protein